MNSEVQVLIKCFQRNLNALKINVVPEFHFHATKFHIRIVKYRIINYDFRQLSTYHIFSEQYIQVNIYSAAVLLCMSDAITIYIQS